MAFSRISICQFLIVLIHVIIVVEADETLCQKFSWQAYLYHSREVPNVSGTINLPLSGVTIISKTAVVTMASVLYGDNNKLIPAHKLFVVYGCGTSEANNKLMTVVESILVYPEYRPDDPSSHNIAILRVASNIRLGPMVSHVKVPVMTDVIRPSMTIGFADWTVNPTFSPTKLDKSMHLNVANIIADENCQWTANLTDRPRKFCAKPMWNARPCMEGTGTGLVHGGKLFGIQEGCLKNGKLRLYLHVHEYINFLLDNQYVTSSQWFSNK